MKNIKIGCSFRDRIVTKINPFLADMLIENLITNAIKHNDASGIISIIIEGNQLIITNTGNQPRDEPNVLFQRFVKSNQKSPSLGLGLPIVKAIGDTYSMPIRYTYENGFHKISIEFRS